MARVLAVVGDRHYSDFSVFSRAVADVIQKYEAEEIVTGDATGVDTMALDYAVQNNVPITVYCASARTYKRLMDMFDGVRVQITLKLVSDWDTDGRAAGHIRNGHVLKHPADRVLVFDGGGPGSANIQQQATALGIGIERWVIDRGTNRALPEELLGVIKSFSTG